MTVVVNLNMFPLSLQVLCFRCTFAIFQTALIKCTCDTNKKSNHDGSLLYVFFARFILAIDQRARYFQSQTNNITFTFLGIIYMLKGVLYHFQLKYDSYNICTAYLLFRHGELSCGRQPRLPGQ